MTTSTSAGLFAQPFTTAEYRDDGSVLLESGIPLGDHAPSMAATFRAAADTHPARALIGQRAGGGWRTVTYGEARRAVDSVAQALLDRRIGERPLMILSGNSIEHLLLTLAGYTAGVPVVPASVAYSLMSHDHRKLRAMAELVDPAVVFADDGDQYAAALRTARSAGSGCELVTPSGAAGDLPATELAELTAVTATGQVDERCAEVGPDTVAKILFTSGSTGHPKGVVNTHRMLCANQQMIRQAWPFLATEPPVLLDWLPWSHTFGGNHNVGIVLANGGTLYVDDGRPLPGMFERTLANLRDVSPTVYFNVPAGYAALVPELERDPELAACFFADLRLAFFAASALPQPLWDRLERLAVLAGRRVPMTTAWGATETAPAATSAHFAAGRSDCIGVPLPGVTVKLAPAGPKTEIRVKGPNVTPGYHRHPELSAQAFDDEGFYRTGDAVRLVDPERPGAGLLFDGRIAEDFKLMSGTWVNVGVLRPALVGAGEGLIRDAVLTGEGELHVGALVWLQTDHARRLAGLDDEATAEALAGAPAVRRELAEVLRRYNAGAEGSAQQIHRLLVLGDPPSLDGDEITDKGYVNQRAVLARRAEAVRRLYAEPPGADVIRHIG